MNGFGSVTALPPAVAFHVAVFATVTTNSVTLFPSWSSLALLFFLLCSCVPRLPFLAPLALALLSLAQAPPWSEARTTDEQWMQSDTSKASVGHEVSAHQHRVVITRAAADPAMATSASRPRGTQNAPMVRTAIFQAKPTASGWSRNCVVTIVAVLLIRRGHWFSHFWILKASSTMVPNRMEFDAWMRKGKDEGMGKGKFKPFDHGDAKGSGGTWPW